jgi:heme-degrading monooxygenase HmoA
VWLGLFAEPQGLYANLPGLEFRIGVSLQKRRMHDMSVILVSFWKSLGHDTYRATRSSGEHRQSHV